MHKKLLLLLLIFAMYINIASAQTDTQQRDLEKFIKEQGSWMLIKESSDLTETSKTFNSLLANKLTPLAIDRNVANETLILAQLSPPAETVERWFLGFYKSEKTMLQGIEQKAREGFIPTSMDVQENAASVLFVKNQRRLLGARIIKNEDIAQTESSINTYYSLGYIPAAMSIYKDSLWILFVQFLNEDISKTLITLRTAPKDDIDKILTQELSQDNISLIDFAFSVDDKVILLFKKDQ